MDESNTIERQEHISFRNLEDKKEFLTRAEAYLEQGLFDRAAALAQERLTRFPGDIDARIIVGSFLVKMEKTEEALEVLKGVESDILNLSRVFEYLGDIYREKDLTEKAIMAYRRFILLNPDLPNSKDVSAKLDSLIDSSHQDTIPDEEDGEDSGDGFEHVSEEFRTITLAKLYMKQGHLEMAREVLDEILNADTGNVKAAEMLKNIDTMLDGKKSEAFSEEKRILIIGELNKWLENLNKTKKHPAY